MYNAAFETAKRHFTPLSKRPFIANVLKLITGSTLGYLSLLLALPLLSRIYTPEAFGLFGMFWAVSVSFSAVSTGGYEYAIILPREDKNAANLLAASVLCVCAVSSLCLIVILLTHDTLKDLFTIPGLASSILWLPFLVLILGLFNVLNFWLTRKKAFHHISIVRFIQQFSIAVAQLSIGYSTAATSTGLVVGVIAGQSAASIVLCWLAFGNDWQRLCHDISFRAIKYNVRRYCKFPRYHFFSYLFNAGREQVPFLFLAHFFSALTVGWYTLTFKILSAPIDFARKAVTPVLMQRISEKKINGDRSSDVILSTAKHLMLAGILPVLGVVFFAPDLFTLFFGESWRASGEYARIIAPAYLFLFVLSPISSVIEVYERLRFRFWEQLVYLFLLVISFGVGGLRGNIELCFGLFTILSTVRSVILIYFIYSLGNQAVQSEDKALNAG